ncbi:MAG: hypothetical protein DRJ07_20905 [Bacteroidetes bacterium]|nr:MAG: hypothetical protein DRJ07_20905 [Bacteroidota bacterium]
MNKKEYLGDWSKAISLSRCPNSMTGKHIKAEKFGKNKNKPDTCKFCERLWSDIKAVNKND